MEEYLKKIVNQYTIEEQKIHPISELDAEFIIMLIDILESGGWKDLTVLLKQYKRVDDQVMLDALAQYSIDIDEDDLDQDQPSKRGEVTAPREFLEIKDRRFRTFALFNMRRTQRWDVDKGLLYSILVNEGPLPGSAQWYMDTYIDYETEEERDKVWNEIRTKMEKQNCTFI